MDLSEAGHEHSVKEEKSINSDDIAWQSLRGKIPIKLDSVWPAMIEHSFRNCAG